MRTADLITVFEDTQDTIRNNDLLSITTQESREKTKCMIPHFQLQCEKQRILS